MSLLRTDAVLVRVKAALSSLLARGERPHAASIVYQAIRTTFLLAIPLGLSVFFGTTVLSIQLLREGNHAIFFQVLAFGIVLYAGVLPVLTGAMLGLQKFKEVAAISVLNTLVRQSLIILLVVLLRSFVGLVIAWVIADLTAASIYMLHVSRILGPPRFDYPLRGISVFSWPLSLSHRRASNHSNPTNSLDFALTCPPRPSLIDPADQSLCFSICERVMRSLA